MKIMIQISTRLVAIRIAATMTAVGGYAFCERQGQPEGHDHGERSHGVETLAFRLPQWKTMHFDDAQKATRHAEAVKKLDCEFKQEQHSGHIDVA